MRLPFLLAAVILAAAGPGADAQTTPKLPGLPTVEKPKAGKPVQNPPPDPEVTPEPEADTKPQPSAKPNPRTRLKGLAVDAADPTVQDSQANAGPEYTGPSILSRGTSFGKPALPGNERFRPFAGLNLYHDSGVTGPYQGLAANTTEQSYTGADVNYGISGQHVRKFDAIQLDYRGHSYLSGGVNSSQDQALSLGYSRVLTRRITVNFSEAGGLYSNNYSVLNSTAQTDTSVANIGLIVTPNTESFDDRTYYSSTQADIAYQKSSRLSFDVGTSIFFVKRDSANLISANGYQTRTDAAYRLTKRSTIGPYYAFSRYNYSGTFGDSGIHTAGLNYSWALNKTLQVRFRGGGTRLETRGLQQVKLDPIVAGILGVQVGTERYYTVAYLPDVAVDVQKNFRHSDILVSYLRGVSPGNGVVLTSRRDSQTITYTYSGLRKYAVTLGGGRDGLSSSVQSIGEYKSYYVRTSLSRAYTHNIQALMSFDFRKLGFSTGQYARNQFRITLGFAFTPGLGPLKFW